MIRLYIFLIVFASSYVGLGAQTLVADQNSPSGLFIVPAPKTMLWNIERSQKKLVKKLKLDLEQQKKFDEINDRYVTLKAAVEENKSLKRIQRKREIKKLIVERDQSQFSMLHPDQVPAWNKAKEKKRKRR